MTTFWILATIVGAILGAIAGFYAQYRYQKKSRGLPSMDDCISAGIFGIVGGALWFVTVPAALITLVVVSIIVLIKMGLAKTGKFSE